MDSYKAWLALLSSVIIQRCQEKLVEECDACKAGLMAPILHYHNHYNLLDTMKKYSTVVGPELDIQQLFNSFIVKFGFFDAPEEEYIKTGQYFVKISSAEAIYYGNYITAEYDRALFGEVTYNVPTYNPSSPQPSTSEAAKPPPAKKARKTAEKPRKTAEKKKETNILNEKI